ncbi:nuclear transport factor 2 family protein [Salinibacter altiplanensis]|uniref:nuclear transport factor 2 family protein n=1 Tax=Salinibacter altiplanensis TaxID=1803181 RepID=UPI001F1A0719|nr:nuclear transport factor 2 family protein [Salinibacter altiplanensis]
MARRGLCVLLLTGLLGPAALAQSGPESVPAEEEAVRRTIEALFDGMRAGDSTAVRGLFHDGARLHTAVGPSDTAAVRRTPVDAFVEAVGQPHEQAWDERTWAVEVRVDGPLASAWVPYAFYLGDERSHCGVNAVQLVRQADGWRILQLTDTRRQDCVVPSHVRPSR